MEQNRTYIVILVITLVSAAVIAAGLYLFSPSADETVLAGNSETFDPYYYIHSNNPETVADGNVSEGDTTEAAQNGDTYGDITVTSQVYGETDNGQPEAAQVGSDAEGSAPTTDTAASGNGATSGQVAAGQQSGPSSSTGTSGSRSSSATSQQTETPATQTTRSSDKPAGSNGGATAATPTTAAAGTSSQASQAAQEFDAWWIQAIASPSRDTVEDAREEIAAQGFGGRISTVENNGEIYYRLRFGPFMVKDEAEKFLEWIQHLEKYSSAYLSLEHTSGS